MPSRRGSQRKFSSTSVLTDAAAPNTMLAKLGRPNLPSALQRDIRKGMALRSRGASNDRSAATAGGLLPGWKEATAADGKTYYFNAESGETRWDRPSAGAPAAKPKVPGTAVVVKVKPVIPGIPTSGIGKLPNGWRMMTTSEGKTYYFNKKTGDTSWDPPPPSAEGDQSPADMEEMAAKAAVAVKEGWRRTKQMAAVKVFKTSVGSDDAALEAQYDQVLAVERQILGVKQVMEAYLKSLVEMCWSAEQLASKLGDYMCEPGAVGAAPAAQAASVWKELQKGAQKSLEVQFTSKVLQPVAAYLGEIEGIKSLHAEHQKKVSPPHCSPRRSRQPSEQRASRPHLAERRSRFAPLPAHSASRL